MSPREAVRQIAGKLAYLVARYWSQTQMTYTHDGQDVSIWVIPTCGATGTRRIWGNTLSQELKNEFVIPIQDNFPPDNGVLINDVLTDLDSGDAFTIRKWSVDSELVCYTVEEAICTKGIQAGAVGV